MSSAKSGAESARRVLDLLFAFTDSPVASVKDLADASGIPTPTVHRYISMLREMGLVEETSRGRYRLSMQVARLSHAARRATSMIDFMSPYMEALSERVGESVLLVQPVAELMVCTHRVEVHRHLRLSFEVGQHLPALRGASAHLYVGSMDERRRAAYVSEMIARGEPEPLEGVEQFLAKAASDAERGWSVSRSEIDEGVSAVAYALHDENGFVGTLSVPMPSARMTEETVDRVLAEAGREAALVSEVLGGRAA